MRASPDLRTGIELIFLPRKFCRTSQRSQTMLDAFQNESNSLAHADAHGAESIFAIGAQELIERRGHQPRAAGAERVTDGNRATVGIYVRGVVWNFQIVQHR